MFHIKLHLVQYCDAYRVQSSARADDAMQLCLHFELFVNIVDFQEFQLSLSIYEYIHVVYTER